MTTSCVKYADYLAYNLSLHSSDKLDDDELIYRKAVYDLPVAESLSRNTNSKENAMLLQKL